MNKAAMGVKLKSYIKIDAETGCWLWQGAMSRAGRRGYGKIKVGGKMLFAHRVAYRVWRGSIPKGLVVAHKCHVKNCINPRHLEAISQRENVRQSIEIGRHAPSLRKGAHCLSHAREEIAKLKRNGLTYKILAEKYGVSISTIWRLLNG